MARGAFFLTLAFYFFALICFFHQFSFLIHNFGSRYARKPIKGSKDSDDSLISKKKHERKNWPLDWHLRPGKVGQPPPLVTPPQEKPKPKTENFFFQSKLDVLPNP